MMLADDNKKAWFFFALLACLTSSCMVLVMKYVGVVIARADVPAQNQNLGVAFSLSTLIVAGAVALLVLGTWHARGQTPVLALRSEPPLLTAVIGVAVLVVVTQLSLFIAVNVCSNPAHAHMLVNFNVILVLIGSFLLFRSPINWISAVGIVLGVSGVILVTHGESLAAA